MKLRKKLTISIVSVLSVFFLVACKKNSEDSSKNANSSQVSALELATNVETKLKNAKLDSGIDDSQDTITTILHFTPPPAFHGNPQVEGGPDWSIQPLIYDYLTDFSSQPEKTYEPQLLETYSWEDSVLTMKLKEGLKYSDGSVINADEVLNNIYVDQSNLQVQSYAESIEKVDDLTIKINYTQDSDLMMTYMLKSQLMFPISDYGKWGEQAKEVFEKYRKKNKEGNYELTDEGQEKFTQIITEKNNYLPDALTMKVSGPYSITKVNSSEITLELNPNYREDLHIKKIIGMRPTSTESNAIAIQNNDYDLEGGGLSADLALKVAQANKNTIRQMLIPEFSQLGFCFNVNKFPTDQLEVRQAIAYIIDIDQIAPASEPGMVVGDKYATGLPPSVRDKYLNSDDLKDLTEYNVNLEKAVELLESVGWSKKGNTWVDEKGESPKIVIAGVGEYPAYVVMGEAAANMLKDFGLNATYTSKEASAYSEYSTSGDANMVIDGFGSPQTTQHPYEAYNGISWYGLRMNLDFPEKGDLKWKDEQTGKEFNYSDRLYELLTANDDKSISAPTKELAEFFNDNMWFLPISEKYYIYRIHNDHLSLAEAPVNEPLSNFYWSGTTSAVLAKMLHANDVYYVK